jgi:hypothetical protein
MVIKSALSAAVLLVLVNMYVIETVREPQFAFK